MTMHIEADDLDDLWDKVNHRFIADYSVMDFTRPNVSNHSYHNTMIAQTAECSKLNLTNLGYTRVKWRMLLGLYFDPQEYNRMINRLRHYKEVERRGKVYVPDIGMQFRSRENRTGACLMGITFRFSLKTGWECSVFTRTNETTARWSVDLIFINRLIAAVGEELGYFTVKDVRIFWTTGSMFQSAVTAPLYMVIMGREKELIKMAKKMRDDRRSEMTPWQISIAQRYCDSYNIKYNEWGKLKYQSYKSQLRVTEAYLYHHGQCEKEWIPNDTLKIPKVDLTIADDFFTKKGYR